MFWAYTGLLTRDPRKCSGMVPKRARNNSRICLSDSQQGSWSLTKNVTKKGPEMGVTREPKWFPNRSQNGFKSEVGNPVRRQEGSHGGPESPRTHFGSFLAPFAELRERVLGRFYEISDAAHRQHICCQRVRTAFHSERILQTR